MSGYKIRITCFLCMLAVSCGQEPENKKGKKEKLPVEDSVAHAPGWPNHWPTEWKALEVVEKKYYALCNALTIRYTNSEETGEVIDESDDVSASRHKVYRTEEDKSGLWVYCESVYSDAPTDTCVFHFVKQTAGTKLVEIRFYFSIRNIAKKEFNKYLCYSPSQIKVLPPRVDCGYEDEFAEETNVSGFFKDFEKQLLISRRVCKSNADEVDKLIFNLVLKENGTLSGTAEQDIATGLARFVRGSWERNETHVEIKMILSAITHDGDEQTVSEFTRTIVLASGADISTYMGNCPK
ncbi:MAG: hypothetical protein ACHQF2_04300 [Flavobacteriales bacterium]